jgi:hypothetical protein
VILPLHVPSTRRQAHPRLTKPAAHGGQSQRPGARFLSFRPWAAANKGVKPKERDGCDWSRTYFGQARSMRRVRSLPTRVYLPNQVHDPYRLPMTKGHREAHRAYSFDRNDRGMPSVEPSQPSRSMENQEPSLTLPPKSDTAPYPSGGASSSSRPPLKMPLIAFMDVLRRQRGGNCSPLARITVPDTFVPCLTPLSPASSLTGERFTLNISGSYGLGRGRRVSAPRFRCARLEPSPRWNRVRGQQRGSVHPARR